MPVETNADESVQGYIVFKKRNYYTKIPLLNAPHMGSHVTPQLTLPTPASAAASSDPQPLSPKKVHFGPDNVKEFSSADPPAQVGK